MFRQPASLPLPHAPAPRRTLLPGLQSAGRRAQTRLRCVTAAAGGEGGGVRMRRTCACYATAGRRWPMGRVLPRPFLLLPTPPTCVFSSAMARAACSLVGVSGCGCGVPAPPRVERQAHKRNDLGGAAEAPEACRQLPATCAARSSVQPQASAGQPSSTHRAAARPSMSCRRQTAAPPAWPTSCPAPTPASPQAWAAPTWLGQGGSGRAGRRAGQPQAAAVAAAAAAKQRRPMQPTSAPASCRANA